MRVLRTAECEQELRKLEPEIGEYRWLWAILGWRARKTGFVPRKLVPLLTRWTDARKPLFIGDSSGVRFLGRCDDRYSLDHALLPGDAAEIAHQVTACLKRRRGAFLDIGANVGLVSARVAQALPERDVFAFEPGTETSCRAAATFALNRLQNVTLLPIAAGAEDGELTFYNSPGNSDFATATPTDFANDDPNLPQVHLQWVESRVPCRRLDTVKTELALPEIALMKIDVEGHELQVLQGAKALIAQDKPDILLEWNPNIAPKLGWTPQDAADLLNTIAPYACFTLLENGQRGAFPPPPDEKTLVNVLAIPKGAPV